MRALLVAVIVMGVLIVAGVVVIAVTVANRLGGGATPGAGAAVQATLDEPPGTHIANVAAASDRLALQLQGGGPDRVVVLDLRNGHVLARAVLAR
jgi:hypothetical protein